MKRRTFIAGVSAAAAGLALPARVRSQSQTTLRFIPQIDLVYLDPVFTTASVTRNHGYLVFDTLYGMDGNFRMSPQMLEGHSVEEDGKVWNLSLRAGLLWHDGEKVLARDCVASIRRWARRDAFGGTLLQATDELSAIDDRTIRFRLKRPFPLLPGALGKTAALMCAMMPERFANTDPQQQVTEMVGSGPFRFKPDERLPGARNVYTRFEGYRPRESGAPDWTAGPKVAHYERIEWHTMPDTSTAASALQTGERDWWEFANHEYLPLLKQARGVQTRVLDPTGIVTMLRLNHLQPPFNNPAIRRALFGAIDQASFMQGVVGDEAALYHTPLGFFCPGTPMASNVGLDILSSPRDLAKVRTALRDAGYAGEKVVLMVPGDSTALKALGDVAADMFKQVGINVDYLALDWGTLLARRNRKGPADQGGWNAFVTSWTGMDWLNPSSHVAIRGNGEAGYAGWVSSPQLEAQREAWFSAPDLAAQQRLCQEMQSQAFVDAPYYPLGQYIQPTAYRTSLTGILNGFPTFWNVRPA
ncbi:peptide/nickel transport system substrate-binding protein [Bosea sp. OK403]|uniref:ABC transporter substrate-binding protein n=1 Tax=Bosea sp. OK403 TaxID=1855286 RepID=UPI0008EE7379|nr:ABC transporter substrate-binding protein [Bosea sp. OK403]SFJ35327.1 peptide/nickel transport system substrate-binding protein [Bosea sp. OK403]